MRKLNFSRLFSLLFEQREKENSETTFLLLSFFNKTSAYFPSAAEKGTEAFIEKHVKPTFPDSDTKILPDHHLSDLAELMGLHGQYILRENMIHISFKDQSPKYAISWRNEFLATRKQTPSLQSHWCKPSLAHRVEQ